MKKNFVLDTNVLLHDPRSLFSFDDNNVVIPIYVIEEVDKFKRDLGDFMKHTQARKYNGKTAARLVLFSPIAHEDLKDRNLPHGAQNNARLELYTAAMGESSPHFHAHMVPRYATMPRDAKAWSVFDLQRAVGAGEVAVDRDEIARISEAYRRALSASPRPW